MACVCGKEPGIEACCGRFLDGSAIPETAEELMRSRYAAYVTQNMEYVEQTHDPATRKNFDRKNSTEWARQATWEGLDIVATEAGGAGDETGIVEFKAHYTMNGQSYAHHERSQFKRLDGRWFFHDGELVKPRPIVRQTPRIGRNDPCLCGSGKKYKKCCGAAVQPVV